MELRRRWERDAFTIAELLIAAAITVVIVVLLGSMFSSLASTSGKANARSDAFRDARAAIHMMERDFSKLVVARPGGTSTAAFFAIDTDAAGGTSAAVRQLEALVSAKNQPLAAAGAPTPAPGDVCAVRYYCGWDATAHAYTLKRFFRDSANTASVLQSTFAANQYIDVGNLYCANVANCTLAPTADEPLASYVWSLRVTAYDSSGNIINPMTDSVGYQTTTAQFICDPSKTSTTPLPATIEISFKAMSPSAARTVIAATNNAAVWMAGDNKTLFQPIWSCTTD